MLWGKKIYAKKAYFFLAYVAVAHIFWYDSNESNPSPRPVLWFFTRVFLLHSQQPQPMFEALNSPYRSVHNLDIAPLLIPLYFSGTTRALILRSTKTSKYAPTVIQDKSCIFSYSTRIIMLRITFTKVIHIVLWETPSGNP